jgi:malate permease and related proteins
MSSYWQLLSLVAPVFILIGLGALLRWRGALTEEAETGLLRLQFNLLYPCLILQAVVGNTALRNPANLLWPPLVGFGTIALGFAAGYYAGRALGLHVGTGLRTFAFTVGIYNYGFIPIPVMESLFGRGHVGVLLVHNVGCELALWSVGLLMLSGLSLREGWRRAVNPVVCTLLVAVAVNLTGAALPAVVRSVVGALGACAIPLGLLIVGATVAPYFHRPRQLYDTRTTPSACLLRLAVLPVAFVLLARYAPLSLELKRVLVVQAAMPSGMMPLVLARHYGGQPLTAAQIIFGTTALGLLVIPLWLRFGLAWVGG